jgi:hypothetical protein
MPIHGRLACKEIRGFLQERRFGELIWLELMASIHLADPEAERMTRRWRRLVKEEWARRDQDE